MDLEEGEADDDFHSDEALAKRQALRGDPMIKSVLRAWWAVADSNGTGWLERDEYITLQTKVYVAMCAEGDSYDAAEALECAERDWKSDSNGGEPLSKQQFEVGPTPVGHTSWPAALLILIPRG